MWHIYFNQYKVRVFWVKKHNKIWNLWMHFQIRTYRRILIVTSYIPTHPDGYSRVKEERFVWYVEVSFGQELYTLSSEDVQKISFSLPCLCNAKFDVILFKHRGFTTVSWVGHFTQSFWKIWWKTSLSTVLRQIFVHCDTFSSTFAAFPRPSCCIYNITK